MTNSKPYNPMSKEILVAADSTAPTGVQCPLKSQFAAQAGGCYRIVNSGTTAVNLGWGKDGATAKANAVIPTAGNPKDSMTLASGGVEIFRLPADTYLSGYSASTANLFITQGEGF